MNIRIRLISAVAICAVLAGCSSKGDIVVNEGVGVTAVRGACPAVGIPDYTGDITLFRIPGNTDANNIDVTVVMTNLRSQCDESAAEKVYTTATFDVLARRQDTQGARQVTVPYFVSVLRGGKSVVSKQIGHVTINFADGQDRAKATAQAGAYVDRAEATLSPEIRERITRQRKPGDADAAVDPLAEPEVRDAVTRASFELLIGFQLDARQMVYNATR